LAGGLSSTEDLLRLASIFRENGKFDRAEALVEEARKHSPRDPSVFLEEGEVNLARREIAKAAVAFRAAIDLDPADVRAYINLKYCVEAGFGDQTASPSPLPVAPSVAPRADLPDIILVSIDTLRADRLGCYGNPRPISPALDAFAREGVLFRRALSQAPVTAPSHMSLFTALMPDVNLVRNHGLDFRERADSLPPRISTFPQLLQSQGYYTAGVHGGGDVSGSLGFSRGFDSYRDSFDHLRLAPGAFPEDISAAVRESRARGKKLSLFVHHYYCHDPYVYGPPEFRRRFLDHPGPGLPGGLEGLGGEGKSVVEAFWKKIDLSRPDHREHVLALYDGGVAYADDLFRRLRELLIREKIYDNALVIVLSDHGEEFYEHQGVRHGRLFIEQLHVPLIVKFPRRRFGGLEISATVRLIDLMPTIFDWAGLPALPRAQGVSFLPLLTGEGSYRPSLVSYSEDLARVRLEEEGFAFCREGAVGGGSIRDWLFAVASDPGERIDLSRERPDLVSRFRKRAGEVMREKKAYLDLMLPDRPVSAPAISPELEKQLRALGYVK
jgi:arylsulfatase A-like enzyme